MIKRFATSARDAMYGVLPEREEGQGMAEYGLILAGVALLAIVAVFLLGPKVGALMNKVGSSLS
jgi:pilus assembly protein Flp/PilA